MNAELSAKYKIGTYGKKGMEIIRHGQTVAKFNDLPTQEENWLVAVEWAKKHPETPGKS